MPRILNPEVLENWGIEDVRELEENISELLRGYPKGIYYVGLKQLEMPDVNFDIWIKEMKKCKTYEELAKLHDKLKKKYGVRKTNIYAVVLLGREKPEYVDCIILKVRKYR